jgi:hypothetical protein
MSLKLELLAAICLISFEPPTEAHDIYSPLKDRWGNSCCNDQDCRPVPYRVTPAGCKCSFMATGSPCQTTSSSTGRCPAIRVKPPEGIGAANSAYCRMRP